MRSKRKQEKEYEKTSDCDQLKNKKLLNKCMK